MKFLSRDHLYVDNMCAKFQVQKIYPKKDIKNIPTCIVVRMIFYIRANFDPQNDTIPRAEKIILTTTHVGRL